VLFFVATLSTPPLCCCPSPPTLPHPHIYQHKSAAGKPLLWRYYTTKTHVSKHPSAHLCNVLNPPNALIIPGTPPWHQSTFGYTNVPSACSALDLLASCAEKPESDAAWHARCLTPAAQSFQGPPVHVS